MIRKIIIGKKAEPGHQAERHKPGLLHFRLINITSRLLMAAAR